MSEPARVLIAEDEPAARRLLRTLLAERLDVTVVGEAGNGKDAVSAIREQAPDIVFLDIRMPELDGFGVIEAVGPARMPVLVFVTAYDEYALQAFDRQAVDYLLKPFDRERLDRAVRRALEQVARGDPRDVGARLSELLAHLKAGRAYPRRIPLRAEGRVRFVDVAAVDWIEADGKTVRIHAGKDVYVVRQTLTAIAEQLDPERFVRVHRSAVVNVDSVGEVQAWFQGDHILILKTGAKITTGRLFRGNVKKLLGE